MGKSFKDQLLKAGLVNKKQVKKAQHEKHVSLKKNKRKTTGSKINTTREEKLAKERASRELNQQLNREKQERENLSQIRQLVKTNCLNQAEYDEPFYFVVGKKIKKVFVNQNIAKQLSLGQMDIVKLDERFEVVPAKVGKQIATRDPNVLVILDKPGT